MVLNFTTLDDIYSIFESLDVNILSSFVLLRDFKIDVYSIILQAIHFLIKDNFVSWSSPTLLISVLWKFSAIDFALLSTPFQLVAFNVKPPLGNSDYNSF